MPFGSIVPSCRGRVVGGGGAAVGTLGAKFTEFWSLGETGAAARVGELGVHNLTATNTPASATGKIGDGCDLVYTSSQNLSVSHANFQPGSGVSFAWCGWFKPSFRDGNTRPIIYCERSGTGLGFGLYYDSTNFYWLVQTSGGQKNAISSGVTPTVGTWYFLVAQFDETADLIRLNVNALTQVTATTSSQALASILQPFYVGGPASGLYAGGVVDQMGWALGNIFTAADITYMLNGTSGRTWAEIYAASP